MVVNFLNSTDIIYFTLINYWLNCSRI